MSVYLRSMFPICYEKPDIRCRFKGLILLAPEGRMQSGFHWLANANGCWSQRTRTSVSAGSNSKR